MKKTGTFIMMLVLTISPARGQFTKVGVGVGYGTGFHFRNVMAGINEESLKSPVINIFATTTYQLNPPFRIVPSFSYFIPRKDVVSVPVMPETIRISSMMFDINGHYIFAAPGRVELHGLAGLNITIARIKWVSSSSSLNDNAIGLNLGAGTCIKLLENFDFYAEIKYILSKYDQFMLNAGILLNIKPAGRNK